MNNRRDGVERWQHYRWRVPLVGVAWQRTHTAGGDAGKQASAAVAAEQDWSHTE
jgi:hypothetical protein